MRRAIAVVGILFASLLITGNAAGDLPLMRKNPVLVSPKKPQIVPKGTTTLKICAQATCREGLGAWLTALSIPPSSRDNAYDLRWTTTAKPLSGARWQVSTRPLSGADDKNGLIAEGDAGSAALGRFSVNFSDLPKAGGDDLKKPGGLQIKPQQKNFQRKHAAQPKIMPPRYYLRVVPVFGGKPAEAISNTIEIDFPGTAPEQKNPLVQLPTDVYTTQILKFEPIKPQTLPWGCLILTGVDKSKFTGFQAASYSLYKQKLDKGEPLCPKSYKGRGEPKWYESFWDFASGGVDWVSGAYSDIKKTAINTIVVGINALPGPDCGKKCKAGLTMGLDAGMVALGVPPSLPNMEALTNQGLDYLVSAAAEQAGIPCDAECQSVIRSGIKKMAADATRTTVVNYCNNVELAHRNGKEPLCLPPGVTAKPAPGSATQPAYVKVRITRKPEATVYTAIGRDRLIISVYSINPSTAGQTYSVDTATCERDGNIFPCGTAIIKVDKPLTGTAYNGVVTNMPRLSPGQTVDYTFYLTPTDFWLPGHKELLDKNGSFLRYNDWPRVYYGSKITITADITCPQTVNGDVSCVKKPSVMYYGIPGKAG